MKLKVAENAIGRIILRKKGWWYADYATDISDKFPAEKRIARKGHTEREKGYGVCTYVKRGVWCHA